MQVEDIERLGRHVKEISLQTEMKKEMKDRLTMGELSTPKKQPSWSTIRVVDDPHSHWKTPPPKFRRQELDFTILDHVGIVGLKSGSNLAPEDQQKRTSRALSIDSRQYRNTMSRSASRPAEEGRNMGTLKRAAMPMLSKPKVKVVEIKEENPFAEEEEGESKQAEDDVNREDSPPVLKRKPRGEIVLTDGLDDLPSPPPPPEGALLNAPAPSNYRLSNLPAIPDDFMTDIFSSLNTQSSVIEEEIDHLQSEKGKLTQQFKNPFIHTPYI